MQAEISDSDAKELWRYWFYEWAEDEYPGLYEDRVFFKGPLERLAYPLESFLNEKVRPGVAAGYITMTPSDPENYVGFDVLIRFNANEIIREMRSNLKQEILFNHWLAMEERGWTWTM